MKTKNVAVLTSKTSWFVPYARQMVKLLAQKRYKSELFFDHKKISSKYETVFILSYFLLIEKKYLLRHRYNLVVHESDLPKGRGWSPLFWQILEGKNRIPVVLFEADRGVDSGEIYIKDYIKFEGHELNGEIRQKQALKSIELCLEFLTGKTCPRPQKGKALFYKKRTPDDSELSLNKTLREQFSKLRIADNDEYPAFFKHKGYKYFLKIYKTTNLKKPKII